MPTKRNNNLVIDLNKVAYAWFYCRNQFNEVLRKKPIGPTVHRTPFDPDEKITLVIGETITRLDHASCLGILDTWTPVVRFRMSCADVLEFTGERAQSLWKAWNEKQFKKKKK